MTSPSRVRPPLALVIVATFAALATGLPGDATDRALAGPSPEDPRPNFLVVITDDQRDGLEVMKATQRRIVNKGVSYPNAFATTPICCPSRSTIFTGLYAHNHGVRNNFSARELDETKTLQYRLLQQGYRTGIIGKYLNGWNSQSDTRPRFFTRWAAYTGKVKNYYEGGSWNVNGYDVRPDLYSTTFIRHKAVSFLRKWEKDDDEQPWLLYLTPMAPHSPYKTLPKYADKPVSDFTPAIEEDRSDKPPYVQASSATPEKGTRVRAKQYRALFPVDDLVKRVLVELQDMNENSETVVFFVSDNALMWSEHGLSKKAVPYTEAVDVNMFMKWPGHVFPGTIDERLVGNVDIAPTVIEAAGVDDDVEMDGRSLLDPSWDRNRMHLEYPSAVGETGEWASTRTDSYQYIEYYGNDGILDFQEYYDLVADPQQMNNLLGDGDLTNDPADLALLAAQLQADRECSGSTCP